MFFQHIYDKSLAQGSYLIGCQATGEAIVIDAKRDVDTYLDIAKQNGLRITHLTETHIHADFLSGTRELEALTGAAMHLSDEGGPDWQYEFPHEGLREGSVIKVGNLSLEVIHTPGHTPESISFLLRDHPATDEPVMLFTGDFVFVGDVGRPDLLEKAAGLVGTQDIGARELFQSLRKFSELPPYVQVWPGHGAGSACGKALGAVPSTTVGYELIRNWAFRFENDEKGFVDYLLTGQPEPPRYFATMKKRNKVDRPLLTEVPKHPRLTKEQFLSAYRDGARIIDARPKDMHAKGAVPGSLGVENSLSFATWVGWLVGYDETLVLVADDAQIEDLTRKLMRIGMDRIIGYIPTVSDLGLALETRDIIDIDTFKSLLGRDDIQVVDVRGATEYAAGHVPGAINLFVGTLADNLEKLDRSKQLVIHCQAGARSAIAQALLAANGFKDVKNFSGGMAAWSATNQLISCA
ncbi:MBL fold metallo-hydrolase [Parapedobacter lycopersici]|uniref:MBL fold metallo-hydrolase n=1 Tax=Parapedobacter lycopersici TaxID=1864939 RepID=UPI00214D5F99|nr:MBL fold metallo-hydrolase [Parapedobacter lycopersici]